MINTYTEGITDDCRLAQVCYTMFTNKASADIVSDAWMQM